MGLQSFKDHSSTTPYILAQDPAPNPINFTKFQRLTAAEKAFADALPGWTPPVSDSGVDVAMHDSADGASLALNRGATMPPGRIFPGVGSTQGT